MSTAKRLYRAVKLGQNLSAKKFVPVGILVVYSFGGAAVFYATEHSHNECTWDYWMSLYFAATIYTTIGYGNIACCSAVGKAFTVIYALVGIPLTVIVLDNVGIMMVSTVNVLWSVTKYFSCNEICGCAHRCKGKTKMEQESKFKKAITQAVIEEKLKQTKQQIVMPIWVGLILTAFWILLSCAYFSLTHAWTYLESVYFLWMSITTIGLGDYSPTRYDLTLINFVFIIIGLSLFSMCINLLTLEIDNLTAKLHDEILRQYKEALQNDTVMENDPQKVRQMMKTKGGALRFFIGKNAQKTIEKRYDEVSKMRSTAAQTEIPMRSIHVQTDRIEVMDNGNYVNMKMLSKVSIGEHLYWFNKPDAKPPD